MREMAPAAANLPDALIWTLPGAFEESQDFAECPPTVWIRREPAFSSHVEARQHLAKDVQLELFRRRIADANRPGALVTGQPAELVLVQAARACEAVHDLDVGRVTGDGAKEPIAECPSLLHVAADHERLQREAGIAQPAVTVVPVPHPSDRLGERRRRGRHDRPSGCKSEPLERDE